MSDERREVLVIAGGGMAMGRALAAELMRAGHEVTVTAYDPPAPPMQPLEVVLYPIDIPEKAEFPYIALAKVTGRPAQTKRQWRKEMKGRK